MAYTVFALIPFQNAAQEGVAKITKIATISEGVVKEEKNQTSLAQLRRNDQRNWLNIKINEKLFYNDNLKLEQNIRLRLRVKNQLQNGTVSMMPYPDLKEPGLYEVKEAQDGSRRVAIEIRQGSGIFTVIKDKIQVNTQGLQSVVESGSTTRALYHVRSDSSGEVYLEQGHLTFPKDPKVNRLNVGEAAYFRNGQITSVFVPTAQLASEYENFIQMNSSTVWKPSLLKRPGFWAGAAAVGVSTAILIIQPWKSDKATGNINVNWGF